MMLSIVVTVDIDNDGLSLGDERTHLSWRGLELVSEIADLIHGFGLPVTWFVRADPQLRDYYGSVGFLLAKHRTLWTAFAGSGDEIGWHPHIYRTNGAGAYEPERDEEAVIDQLRSTHADLVAQGHKISSVRMGEAIGGNAIIRTLAELGLRVDSSAIPGRRRDDKSRGFDWTGSPNEPYWPSVADYRIPGTPALPILEIPMTVVPVHAPYDPTPLPRYANLTYRPVYFSAALEQWARLHLHAAKESILTLILHPDELIAGSNDHPLYAFTFDALRANIEAVLELIRVRNIDMVGLTMSGVASRILKDGMH